MQPCDQAKRIGDIEGEISDFRKNFKEVPDDVKEIRNALLGDEYNPEGGIIKQIGKFSDKMLLFEERLAKVERFQYKALVWVVVVVGIITFAFKIYDLIK